MTTLHFYNNSRSIAKIKYLQAAASEEKNSKCIKIFLLMGEEPFGKTMYKIQILLPKSFTKNSGELSFLFLPEAGILVKT